MKLEKALRRDRKIQRRKRGMKVDGRSILLLEELKKEKAEEIKLKRKEQEEMETALMYELYGVENEQQRRYPVTASR